MGLESGTYVDDLVVTNPPGSDDKRQGDDHIRLIKTVLRNTLKRASKAFSLPGTISKTGNYTVLSTDDNLTISCDTSSAEFTLTLPILSSGDAGWCVYVLKTNAGANAVYLDPGGGALINGYSYVRRSIENAITKVIWTGSVWVASRPNGGAPIGSVVEYYGSSLPNGHLWADGAAVNSGTHLELSTAIGASKPDRRGRAAFGRDDMGTGAANRVTNAFSGIAATTLMGSGGNEGITLSSSTLPTHNHTMAHTHSFSATSGTSGVNFNHAHDLAGSTGTANSDGAHQHTYDQYGTTGATAGGVGVASSSTSSALTGSAGSHTHSVTLSGVSGGIASAGDITLQNNHTHSVSGTTGAVSTPNTGDSGSGGPHQNMPPTLICNAIVVAE